MAHDIFISYTTEPELSPQVANGIVLELERRGIRCWIAPRNLNAGEDYMAQLSDRVSESKALILVFSDEANHSPHVKREVGLAFENEVQIIPFRIEDVQPDQTLKYCIGQVHWFDALTSTVEAHIKDFADRIEAKFEHEVSAPGIADQSAPPSQSIAAKRKAAWPAVLLGIIAVAVAGTGYFFSGDILDVLEFPEDEADVPANTRLPAPTGKPAVTPQQTIETEDAILAEFNLGTLTNKARIVQITFSINEYLDIRTRWDTCRTAGCADLDALQKQLFDTRETSWSDGDVSGVIRIVSARKTSSLNCPWRISIEEVLRARDRTRRQQRTYCTSNGFDATVEGQGKVS